MIEINLKVNFFRKTAYLPKYRMKYCLGSRIIWINSYLLCSEMVHYTAVCGSGKNRTVNFAPAGTWSG